MSQNQKKKIVFPIMKKVLYFSFITKCLIVTDKYNFISSYLRDNDNRQVQLQFK